MGYPSGMRGYLSGVAALDVATRLSMGSGSQLLIDPGTVNAPGMAFTNDTDIGPYRVSSNNTGWAGGGGAVAWQMGGQTSFNTGSLAVTSYIYIPEVAAPGAIANYAVLGATDSGGKTRLNVQFGTGSNIQVAIEV